MQKLQFKILRVNRGSGMTRVDESVIKIKDMILNKEYDQEGYLPCEGDLSEQLGVSRATIREAIRTLEVREFLKRIHGKGIQVTDNGVKVMTRSMKDMFERDTLTYEEILEVRWIMETKATEMAAKNATEDDEKELLCLVEQMEATEVINDTYLECDLMFHKKLAECSRNRMLESIVNAYTPCLDEQIKVSSRTTINLEKTYHYHRKIYEAVKEKDEMKAKACMEEHLEASHKNQNLFGGQAT